MTMSGGATIMDEARELFEKTECLGRPLVVSAMRFPEGIQVSLYGGHLPHIGAVTVADPEGSMQTTLFLGHRDDVVSRRWAQRLKDAGILPAVVVVGIHYDGLTKDGIHAVVQATDALLDRLLRTINDL